MYISTFNSGAPQLNTALLACVNCDGSGILIDQSCSPV